MPAGCRNPEGLYEEGRKDFNQKFTKAAIEKFEEAYRCSKDPLILYNIGIAYKRVYDEEKQRERLEKAKQALSTYVQAIEQDPSLGADPEEVRPILQEIDEELARLTPQEPTPVEPDPVPPPEAPKVDPGRKLRMTGIGLMSGGGVLTVVGGALAVTFALKGRGYTADINALYKDFKPNGCDIDPLNDAPSATMCDELRAQRDSLREDGFKANTMSAVFAVVGVVGLGLLIGGAVAYTKGKRTSDKWRAEEARLRVLPGFGGMVLQGRF